MLRSRRQLLQQLPQHEIDGHERQDEQDLADLDADVEKQQRRRQLRLRQPDLAQHGRETEPVQESERDRDGDRKTERQR